MKLWELTKTIFSDPGLLIEILNTKGYISYISDKTYIKWLYRRRTGKNLNINNPQTFNEKLQYLKLHDRNPLYTKLADKYEVRKYVAEKIGHEYLIPLLGVWNNTEEINWDSLPSQFVLKCTHDSGGVIICKDKSKFDIEKAKKKLNKLLSTDYYLAGREWQYKNIKRKIIAEKYMVDVETNDLRDYKFMCINGKPIYMFIISGRSSDVHSDYYDLNFNRAPFYQQRGLTSHTSDKTLPEKPKNFHKMIELAKKLSADIPQVRVDFYEVDGHVYFGELTFFDGSGFNDFIPEKYNKILGDLLNLPTKE